MSDAILPVYGRSGPVFERGEGVRLFDRDGRAYLDFIGGIAVNAFGHAHPALVNALTGQAGKLWHLSNMYEIPGQQQLAQRWCELSFADRAFFTNSGTEAIELALKLARRFHWAHNQPERIGFLSFEGSFHGRSLAAINAGAQEKYREGFGPRLPGFRSVEFGDHEALQAAIAEPDLAAVIIEPVQGEGGVREVPEQCLLGLRQLCNAHGVLLIYDEVQCGAGRTGQFFHHQWTPGAEPDILAAAKGIGGGFPLGMCLTTETVGTTMAKGTHGSTYGGNPLAMAVGLAVVDLLTKPGFMEQVRRVSSAFTQSLASLRGRYPDLVVDITGRGFLRGLKLTRDPLPLRAELMERGLLVGTAGGNVIRLAPPLIASEADMREAIDLIDAQFSSLKLSAES